MGQVFLQWLAVINWIYIDFAGNETKFEMPYKHHVNMVTGLNILIVFGDEYLSKPKLHSPDTRVFNTLRLEEIDDSSHNLLAFQ